MKVYQLLNQLKGTNATLEQIKSWSYMNRITPCILEDGMELDCEYPEALNRLQGELCSKITNCYPDCLDTFFELEVEQEGDNEINR